MKSLFYIFILIISCFFSVGSYSQSIPVGMSMLDEYYRRAQLLGEIDINTSFTIRPIFPMSSFRNDIFDADSTLVSKRFSRFDGRLKFAKEKGILQLLPISILNQFNSHHPEGINDGSMIPSKGFQTQISTGIYTKFGPLSIQLKPELIYLQNKSFDGFPQNYTTQSDIDFPSSPYSGIDLPERFGNEAYNKVFWGQSSMRLTFGAISFGLSNENLWWGPGYRNTLLMTNSAPGFKHLTINTVKPIKTFIGSFEGQIIGGKLEESGFTENLPNDWRYINAVVLSYNPKWIPGLFLGATRSFLTYNSDMGKSLGDYLPVIGFITKKAGETVADVDALRQNQLISVFMRWLFVESNGEIYLEYGRDDHAWDLHDLLLEPSHSSGFIIGFRKLFSINKQKETYFQLILETTNLASPKTTINRNHGHAGSWYQHGQVLHGYTNEGQLLGAGIGPGSNLQTLDISWVKSLKQIGIQLERYVHNNDFWYNYVKDTRSNWVDLSTTAFVNWDFNNILLSFKLKYVSSINYQWINELQYIEVQDYWLTTDNTNSFQAQLNIIFRF